jgi:hypothetical protein
LLSLPHGSWHRPGGFNGLRQSKSFRAHRMGLEEFLEEWYDRSAESCDLFENISEVDKYSVTCTVCSRFEEERCSPGSEGPSILSLLKASYKHDSVAWQ